MRGGQSMTQDGGEGDDGFSLSEEPFSFVYEDVKTETFSYLVRIADGLFTVGIVHVRKGISNVKRSKEDNFGDGDVSTFLKDCLYVHVLFGKVRGDGILKGRGIRGTVSYADLSSVVFVVGFRMWVQGKGIFGTAAGR